jgi:hypothetical protein
MDFWSTVDLFVARVLDWGEIVGMVGYLDWICVGVLLLSLSDGNFASANLEWNDILVTTIV